VSEPQRRDGDGPAAPTRFYLLDAAALVVGYGLASLLVRAYWPRSGAPTVWEASAIGLVFLWLGLAMSGPVVLLIRRPAPAAEAPGDDPRPEPRTWAELAWMIIGYYWIALTVLVVPTRMDGGRFLDSALLGVFPVLAALVLRYVGPRRSWARERPAQGGPTWTHRAGVALLLTWPFAWVGLILLGKTWL
jgi:hypothetical protein